MRSIFLTVVVTVFSSVLSSQPNSTRLSAMGNVSIAVPDPESEAFLNPARATRLRGVTLRLTPAYARNSFVEDRSTKSSSGGSFNGAKSNLEQIQTGIMGTADAVVSLAPLFWGVQAGYGSNSVKNSSDYSSQNSGSSTSNVYSYEESGPSSIVSLLAALDIQGVSVGVSALQDHSKVTLTNSSAYSSSPYGSPYSYLDEAEEEGTNTDLRVGLVGGSTDTYELAAYGILGSTKVEQHPTRSLYNGVPQPISDPSVARYETSRNSLLAEARLPANETLLLGARIQRNSSSTETFQKMRWYDSSNPQGVYTERKTGTTDLTAFEFGVGCSWHVSTTGLFAAELVLSPSTLTSKSYYTESGTTPDGRPYRVGGLNSQEEDKILSRIIRVGGELRVTDEFTVRAGVEVLWATQDDEWNQNLELRTEKLSGDYTNSLSGGGGLSYNAGTIRIDYAITFIPTYRLLFIPYYDPSGPTINYTTFQQDVNFYHAVTVALQL
ncbi:MAG: hypothetical protein WBD36_04570 [Bacteroidota bacterium]